jgi:hypothetical protein
MSLRIVISNLPPETTVDGLRAGVAGHWGDAKISLTDEGNTDRVTAVLILGDMHRPTADRLADNIDGTFFEGRRLRAFVPLFF